jgi:hypothetical protein
LVAGMREKRFNTVRHDFPAIENIDDLMIDSSFAQNKSIPDQLNQ